MSELIDGIRVITEGPPPVRDVTDAPVIPARFTPPPARSREVRVDARAEAPQASPASATPAEDAPSPAAARSARRDPEPSPVSEPALELELGDTLAPSRDLTIDPEWSELEVRPRPLVPPWWIGTVVVLAALAIALGLLAVW